VRFEPRTPAEHLLDILGGKARLQAISTAAALGLADVLANGPRTVVSLAQQLGCREDVLATVLRLCAGLDFFASPEPGLYTLTERGQVLKQDQLGPLATFVGAPEQWDPWARLRDAARSGGVAFVHTFGHGLYEHVAADDAAAARYDAAIDAFTRHEAEALCRTFDFASAHEVVDVGGGHGTLLLEVLRHNGHLHGTLFDLPHVAERALPRLRAELGERVRTQGGDFFASIPRGADVMLLKHVLHNWDDERAAVLLQRCAEALPPGGRLLVIETILAPDNRADLAAMLDLEMMVLLGGRERRKPELRRMLSACGLSLSAMEPLVSGSWLLVAEKRAGA
jgi:SAM-dependent methyltransferase